MYTNSGAFFSTWCNDVGFLSNRKIRLGQDMLDDPDVQAALAELEEDTAGGDIDRTDEEKKRPHSNKTSVIYEKRSKKPVVAPWANTLLH